jgi:DNA adenine methylase
MQVVPFLKWAGGKRWFASGHSTLIPQGFRRLIEPFCGSAAIFFHVAPDSAILSDVNDRLIEVYFVIRNDPKGFTDEFRRMASLHSKDFYYETRSKKFDSSTKRAAQFLYLNRVCFNGIYRENLKGEFNVPVGTKTRAELATDDFFAVSRRLASATIRASDFESVIDEAGAGDFLFVDPPYTVKHNNNGFVKYNQKIFTWDDQIRLAEATQRASFRGAQVVVTNADHEDVRRLYHRSFKVLSVERQTVIASSPSARGQTSEMVATNVI